MFYTDLPYHILLIHPQKVVKSGKKYQKLNMVDEEVGAETVRPRTPTKKGEVREDQEPLLEE